MKLKIGQWVETTLIVIYLLGCIASTAYIVRSIVESYSRAAPYLNIG